MSASFVDVSVVIAEGRLIRRLVLEAEQAPAGVVAVPAPGRQPEGADDGVEPDGLEERRLLDLAQEIVLLAGGQAGEGRAGCCRRGAAIQVGNPVDVLALLRGVEGCERTVDEPDRAGFARTGPAVHRR